MHLTCKCLNVSVKTRGNELKQFKIDDENLTDVERLDEFFQEPLATAVELENIIKEQPGLIVCRNIGSWVINRCINCSMDTHAVHRDYGVALVLINTNIVSSAEEINKIKSHSNYSPIFRIIIDHNSLEDNDQYVLTKYSVSQLSNNLQTALASLQQQLEQSVQKKTLMIEEAIRKFTAEQYQLLEEFREQAHLEHRVLARMICSHDSGKSATVTNTTMKIPTPERTKMNFIAPVSDSTLGKLNNSGFMSELDLERQSTPQKVKNVAGSEKKVKRVKSLSKNENVDAEAMFDLEGMDDTITSEAVEVFEDEEEDTDDSGQDEGIHIPRGQRGGHPTLAKSLPVSVPNFSCFARNPTRDQDDNQLSMDPRDPNNIRASIKALAKSVHGDAVFGDLPRPRFSTQI